LTDHLVLLEAGNLSEAERDVQKQSTGPPATVVSDTIVVINIVRLDRYVLDSLMADLVGHDRSPSAFLVYLALWGRVGARRGARVRISHRELAEETGLSKSAVQSAIRRLTRRRLVSAARASATATPEYSVLRPWRR
jgi:hypothetical protein